MKIIGGGVGWGEWFGIHLCHIQSSDAFQTILKAHLYNVWYGRKTNYTILISLLFISEVLLIIKYYKL